MNPAKLIRMANQIGGHFAHDPDRSVALAQIADHLRRFWAPLMRRTLIEHVDSGEQAEVALEPLVVEALRAHREQLLGKR